MAENERVSQNNSEPPFSILTDVFGVQLTEPECAIAKQVVHVKMERLEILRWEILPNSSSLS